jgi:hypothetical protein
MSQNLRFRRQFFLTTLPSPAFPDWTCLEIPPYFLYAHRDLGIAHAAGLQRDIVLLGEIYSPTEPEKGNQDILRDLLLNTADAADLFVRVKLYAGNFALLHQDRKGSVLFHDPLALREIYYCTRENRAVCASQPNLLIAVADPAIPPNNNDDFRQYYARNSKDGKWNPSCRWIGDETFYQDVKHLLPNHYLDLRRREPGRYWPNEAVPRLDLADAVAQSCAFLRGSLRAVVHRHSAMMAVTAGTDSRTLLSAAKDLTDKIYFFINNQGLGHHHPDIAVPRDIFEKIGIPFHVHDVPSDVDHEFQRIFLGNTFFASERILPTIYNVYYKNHAEKTNVLGIGEIGRNRFGKEPKTLNGYRLAYKLGHRNDRYALNQGRRILAELLPVGKQFGLNVLTLLYWEHWLGNWGATGNSESDIAIEEINPLDSHRLYEIFLGVEPKYAGYYNPVIFKEMIRAMWPELLKWPINPPHSKRDKAAQLFKRMGLYPLLKELKFQIHYAKYRRRETQGRRSVERFSDPSAKTPRR